MVVLVVGIPGAGKTTLIDRATRSPEWVVLDLDRFRRRLPPALRKVPVPYPLYVVAVIAAIARHPYVVVESRGTYAWMRRLVAACARVCRREPVLVLLDAPVEDATAGQVRRGRLAPAWVMRWNTAHWSRLLDEARTGALAAEGWKRMIVLDRADASQVESFSELLVRGAVAHGSRLDTGLPNDRPR